MALDRVFMGYLFGVQGLPAYGGFSVQGFGFCFELSAILCI
jgi:hypothetical protein